MEEKLLTERNQFHNLDNEVNKVRDMKTQLKRIHDSFEKQINELQNKKV